MTQALLIAAAAHTVAAALEERRQAAARSQRAWLHQEQERLQDAARQEACQAFEARAREHGYCLDCWGRSTDWGMWTSQARIVRHRRPENCPAVRRRRA